MRYIILNIYLSIFIVVKSQNLVPNPSFENYVTCPSNGNLNNQNDWIRTIGTADYYSSCSTNSNISVPKNFSGNNFQIPRTGNSYVGVQTIVSFVTNTRENIGVNLTSTLISNNYYLVKFYVANVQCYKIANNNMALNFSSSLTYTVNSGSTVNLPMHIYKFGNPVIKDTLNWTEIMGIYKANGNEQYITIGNFKDDANTKIDTTNYGSFGYAAYYMIDDVSVEPTCTPFWSYRDTTVTLGDSVLIGPAITGLNINWYDATGTFITNAPGIYVKPNSPTFYTASEDFCNGITSHTINVMVTPTSVNEYIKLQNSIKLFPNPTINNFVISTLTETAQLKVEILDVQGKLITSEIKDVSNYNVTILTNLNNGVYFVSITDIASGSKTVKKLVVQK